MANRKRQAAITTGKAREGAGAASGAEKGSGGGPVAPLRVLLEKIETDPSAVVIKNVDKETLEKSDGTRLFEEEVERMASETIRSGPASDCGMTGPIRVRESLRQRIGARRQIPRYFEREKKTHSYRQIDSEDEVRRCISCRVREVRRKKKNAALKQGAAPKNPRAKPGTRMAAPPNAPSNIKENKLRDSSNEDNDGSMGDIESEIEIISAPAPSRTRSGRVSATEIPPDMFEENDSNASLMIDDQSNTHCISISHKLRSARAPSNAPANAPANCPVEVSDFPADYPPSNASAIKPPAKAHAEAPDAPTNAFTAPTKATAEAPVEPTAMIPCAMALSTAIATATAKRKRKMDKELMILSNKARFVKEVCGGDLVVINRERKDLLAELKERGYGLFPKKKKSDVEERDGAVNESPSDAKLAKGYKYLLGMKTWHLTLKHAKELHTQMREKTEGGSESGRKARSSQKKRKKRSESEMPMIATKRKKTTSAKKAKKAAKKQGKMSEAALWCPASAPTIPTPHQLERSSSFEERPTIGGGKEMKTIEPDMGNFPEKDTPIPEDNFLGNMNDLLAMVEIESIANDYKSALCAGTAAIIDEVLSRLVHEIKKKAPQLLGSQGEQQKDSSSRRAFEEIGGEKKNKKRKVDTQQEDESNGCSVDKTSLDESDCAPIFMRSGDMSWNHDITKEKLVHLNQVLTSTAGLEYLLRKAKDSKDESITLINGAVEIFLHREKGGASAYLGLKKLYKRDKKHLFLTPETMSAFIQASVSGNAKLHGYNITQPAIILKYKPGPQPTHADTIDQENSEKIGIFMLSNGAPGTNYYNMNGCRRSPNIQDLKSVWKDAPEKLLEKITNSGHFREFGQLLLATPDRRVQPGTVGQFSTMILNGCHPHCAPSRDGMRAVLFFVLQPSNFNGKSYRGDTQCSREKLCLLLYEDLSKTLTPDEKETVMDHFVNCIEESASFGARDSTIDFGCDELGSVDNRLQKAMVSLQEVAINAHKRKLMCSQKEEEYLLAKKELDHASNRLLLSHSKEAEQNHEEKISALEKVYDEYISSMHILASAQKNLGSLKMNLARAIPANDFLDSFDD